MIRFVVAIIGAGSVFAGGTITGTVADQSGAYVPNAIVRLTPAGSGETKYRGESDADGKFKIDGIAPGEYFIRARAPGFRESAMKVAVNDAVADVGKVKLPIVSCDAPGVNCDEVWASNSPPPKFEPDLFRGRVSLSVDSVSSPDLMLYAGQSGALYLNPINGTTLGPCEAKPTTDPIRIDGLGPGNDWCGITHDKHHAHVFITGGIVEPGVKEVPLWIVIRK